MPSPAAKPTPPVAKLPPPVAATATTPTPKPAAAAAKPSAPLVAPAPTPAKPAPTAPTAPIAAKTPVAAKTPAKTERRRSSTADWEAPSSLAAVNDSDFLAQMDELDADDQINLDLGDDDDVSTLPSWSPLVLKIFHLSLLVLIMQFEREVAEALRGGP